MPLGYSLRVEASGDPGNDPGIGREVGPAIGPFIGSFSECFFPAYGNEFTSASVVTIFAAETAALSESVKNSSLASHSSPPATAAFPSAISTFGFARGLVSFSGILSGISPSHSSGFSAFAYRASLGPPANPNGACAMHALPHSVTASNAIKNALRIIALILISPSPPALGG